MTILREQLAAARERISALERENAGLKAALKPFAELANAVDALRHPDDSTCEWRIKAADLRKARAALSAPGEGKGTQYRCLWEERMASMNGPFWMKSSGRVHTEIGPCVAERVNRLQDPKFRRVHIEAREETDGAWPRPWDADSPVAGEGKETE